MPSLEAINEFFDPGNDYEPPYTVTIMTPEGGALIEYEFVAEGQIQPGEGEPGPGGPASAEIDGNDNISRSGEEYRASGKTGNGYGDAFTVHGPIVGGEISGTAQWVLDGEEVTMQQMKRRTAPSPEPTVPPAARAAAVGLGGGALLAWLL